jgi:hypothetical protein
MTLESRINRVGSALRILVERLSERGFKFERPASVFPGPEAGTAGAVARLEQEIGALPIALKLFWREVGSVDFCGYHPEWKGCELPDPIVIYPPSIAIQELDEFLADREERLRHDFPYLVPIAPDLYHKAGFSGGMWYNMSVPGAADDPLLNDEWHHTTFVTYLELVIQWAGFPGLSRCRAHTWPVEDLVRDL